MSQLTRRTLLAGAAATGALAATATGAHDDKVKTTPYKKGRSGVITGCSSGFGRLAAEHFARAGAKVFATMRRLPRQEADELRVLALNEKLDLQVIEIDVTSDEQVEIGVKQALISSGGTLYGLIYNAGC